MNNIVQYPDLTEVVDIGNYTLLPIKTRFAFAVTSPYQTKKDYATIIEAGFKHIRSMNNWFYGHRGDWRQLKFFWYENPNGKDTPTTPMSFGGATSRTIPPSSKETHAIRLYRELSRGGCGFKLVDNEFSRPHYFQFFTLLRRPLNPLLKERVAMEASNFNMIGQTENSSFWLNGWKPKKWSVEAECKLFNMKPEDWDNMSTHYIWKGE